MRPQNGDSQHGVPPLNIGSATNRNGRLVNVSDHVGNITNIFNSLGRWSASTPPRKEIASFPGGEFCVFSVTSLS
jgi:hypothetical protein